MPSYHIGYILDNERRAAVIECISANIKSTCLDYDCICCTGISGLVVASSVSLKTGLPLVIVRKKVDLSDDERHPLIECPEDTFLKPEKVIFIDDLIHTGTTLTHVFKSLEKTFPSITPEQIRNTKIYLYHEDYYNEHEDIEYTRELVRKKWGISKVKLILV